MILLIWLIFCKKNLKFYSIVHALNFRSTHCTLPSLIAMKDNYLRYFEYKSIDAIIHQFFGDFTDIIQQYLGEISLNQEQAVSAKKITNINEIYSEKRAHNAVLISLGKKEINFKKNINDYWKFMSVNQFNSQKQPNFQIDYCDETPTI